MRLKIFEKKLKCPRCKSDDVLVGNDTKPNHCSSCDHEWKAISENIVCLKCVPKFLTINQSISNTRRTLYDKIDKVMDDK